MKANVTQIVLLLLAGCGPSLRVETNPVRVEPIHVTVDVNIRLDRELDRFFDFQDEAPGNAPEPELPQPADDDAEPTRETRP